MPAIGLEMAGGSYPFVEHRSCSPFMSLFQGYNVEEIPDCGVRMLQLRHTQVYTKDGNNPLTK